MVCGKHLLIAGRREDVLDCILYTYIFNHSIAAQGSESDTTKLGKPYEAGIIVLPKSAVCACVLHLKPSFLPVDGKTTAAALITDQSPVTPQPRVRPCRIDTALHNVDGYWQWHIDTTLILHYKFLQPIQHIAAHITRESFWKVTHRPCNKIGIYRGGILYHSPHLRAVTSKYHYSGIPFQVPRPINHITTHITSQGSHSSHPLIGRYISITSGYFRNRRITSWSTSQGSHFDISRGG